MSHDSEIMNILNEQSRALGRIESNLKILLGNGSPGLIDEMRGDISDLKNTRSNIRGYVAGFSGALVVGEAAFHYLLRRLGIK